MSCPPRRAATPPPPRVRPVRPDEVDAVGALTADVYLAGGLAGEPYAEIAAAGEAELRMLVVAPTARRRGVGELLVRVCLDRARRRGCARMVLSSSAAMTAAHRLYGRLGFRRAPERDWSPVPAVRLLAFVLDLTSS